MRFAMDYGIPHKLDKLGSCHFALGAVRDEVAAEANRLLKLQMPNAVFCDRYGVLAICIEDVASR